MTFRIVEWRCVKNRPTIAASNMMKAVSVKLVAPPADSVEAEPSRKLVPVEITFESLTSEFGMSFHDAIFSSRLSAVSKRSMI